MSEITKEILNKFAPHPLQSWEWGEFRGEWGNKIVRVGIEKDGILDQVVQIVFSKIPGTSFTIGNLLKGPTPTKEQLEKLKEVGKENNALFIKLEPADPEEENRDKIINLLKKYCTEGKRFFTPTTFYIDLTRKEEDILLSFHPKTRYNIRVATKNGVTVKEDNSPEAFKEYLKLTKETVERQGFYSHTKRYHTLMWEILSKAKIAHLLTARYQGEIISTWILFAWKNFLYYPYGASTEKHKNVMASNLMMWEAILFGKKLGLSKFDLWGREEGKGFTKFKEGYNPKVIEFLGSWDLVISPLYYPYRVLEFIRWLILRTKSKFTKPTF